MKLTTFLLFIALLQVSAEGFSQINLHETNAPLAQVLKSVEKQSGYVFVYNSQQIQLGTITADLKNASIQETLQVFFKDKPITYQIVDKNVVLLPKKEEPTLLDKLKNALTPSPSDEIRGTVKNKAGEPMAGASVAIKRTGYGAVTDAKGTFKLKNVKPDDILIISFIGYNTQIVKLAEAPSAGSDGYIITLQETSNPLDEVVVRAYGETSQRLSTGDIATISAKEIEKQPVMNPLLALQGRMAGVDVQPTSGYASGPVNVTIRGLTAIDGSATDPLYVIDGVPLTVVQIGGARNYQVGSGGFIQNNLTGPANGQSPLFSIDPSNIESISVLKDADATSIYGSRGANGVILINTKKGKSGTTQFNANVQQGYSTVSRHYDLLNTQQYLAMRREAFHNDGITPTAANAPDLVLFDQNRYTNWQKALWGRMGANSNTQMSLSGGDAQTTFRIAANYIHSTEITTASGADQRASVSFNLTHRSLSDKFSVSLTSQYSYTQTDAIQMPGSSNFAPNSPSIYNADGTLNWKDWEPARGNPFGVLLQPYTAKTNFLNSNLTVKYEILRGLSFSTSFGYNTAQVNQVSLRPIASQDPASNPTGRSRFGNNNNQNWIIEPQLIYNTQIWKGKLSVLLGGSAQSNSTEGLVVNGSGYTNDDLLRTISNAPYQQASDYFGKYRYASMFGRIGYNVNDKYIIDFNSRRDGSSNYGPGNQYGAFASVGGAWLFTNEDWFKNHPSFLSFGKLQASYGTAGSDGGTPYAYLTRWSSSGLVPYNGVAPLLPEQHANPNYQWQKNRQLEVSANLGFFKDWITINAAFYDRRTDNELLPYPTTYVTGFTSVLENLPALVENKGWEFTIGGKGVNTTYFQWAPSFNFSFNQNKFVSFPGLGGTNYFQNGLLGHPLNGVYLLHYTGVDPQTGQYTFQDVNHDGQIIRKPISQGGDEYFKSILPTFQTGFGFNSGFKGFKLSLFFSVKKQTGINVLAQGNSPGGYSNGTGNQPIEVLNRWQQPGQITNTGKFSTVSGQDPNGFLYSSDIGYTDASYIRLQNASLAYQLPEKLAKKIGMRNCSLFINANNLLTITGYKGIDPDVQGFNGLPTSRTIVGGINVGF